MLRQSLRILARNQQVERVVTGLPIARTVAARFVPGDRFADVLAATTTLVGAGAAVSIAHLLVPARDEDQAEAATLAHLELLEQLHCAGLARHGELSLRLSSIGQAVPDTGAKLSIENARRIAHAARISGTAITLEMENHGLTDQTLEVLREVRKDYPETGAVLQASLRRTEDDCRALAYEGSRVRLCKGAYDEPGSHAFADRHEIDKSFVRCLKVLMAGQGFPMVATHDPRLIKIASALATRYGRAQGSYEFQLFFGVRTQEQARLIGIGEQVRVYVPFGSGWYGYLMRSLAERPANLTSFVRSLLSQK